MKKILTIILLAIGLIAYSQETLRKGFVSIQNNDTVWLTYNSGVWTLESDTTFIVNLDTLYFADGTKLRTANIGGVDSLFDANTGKYTSDTIAKIDSSWYEINSVVANFDTTIVSALVSSNKGLFDSLEVQDLAVRFDGQIYNKEYLSGSTQSYLGLFEAFASIFHSKSGTDMSNIELDGKEISFESFGSASFEYKIIEDTIFADGTNDSYENNAKFKNFFANIGGFFGRILQVDKATMDTLVLADVVMDTAYSLKDAVELETFDSLKIGYSIRFNESEGVHEFATKKEGVVWQGALEDLVQVYNNTGIVINNGTPFYLGGSIGDSIVTIGIASANIPQAKALAGLITGEIGVGEWGYGAVRGKVRGLNTTSLSLTGVTWLGNDSTYTMTAPAYPSEKIIIGGAIKIHATEGIIYVSPSLGFIRQLKTKSYSFTSLSIAAGEHWKAGFYDASLTDANLTQAAPSITYGTADVAYEAHPFAVYGGTGSVTGGGRVALIVTGTSYDDLTGTQTPADVDTIITDITNTVLNIYDEAKKYHGTVTYQLVVVEGAPSAYSLDFNYGYAKYDDINDKDFYITGVEAVWFGDGTDISGFDIELYKHTQTGWTYSAAAFSPGDGVLAQRSVDQAGFLRVTNSVESAWKRSSLDEFIDGDGEEGFLFKITTGTNSTIQTMDLHVEVAID